MSYDSIMEWPDHGTATECAGVGCSTMKSAAAVQPNAVCSTLE